MIELVIRGEDGDRGWRDEGGGNGVAKIERVGFRLDSIRSVLVFLLGNRSIKKYFKLMNK